MEENKKETASNVPNLPKTKSGNFSEEFELGKLPPQALKLEMALLGALMLEKDALTRVIDIIRKEIFYKKAHQTIFETIFQLFSDSQPVDLMTVSSHLRKNGQLQSVGGAFYLTELTSRVASAANIEYYARVITENYLKRQLIEIGGKIVKEAYDDTVDVFDLLDDSEQNLFELSETNLRRNYEGLGELIHKAIGRLEEIKEKGDGITGVPSGFNNLDAVTSGWQPSDLIIIAGRPAMGKTAFTLSLAKNAAVDHGKGVAFFSLEMGATQIAQRLIAAEAELDQSKLRSGKLEYYEWHQLTSRAGNLSNAPIYIDDTPALSVTDLRAKCRRLKAEKDIQIIIIDYLQLMTTGSKRSNNREQEIAYISRALKEIAKEINVPVIALSQLSRAVESRGGDKRPMLSDLRESGSIEQDADMVLFLYRAEYYNLETYEDGTPTHGIGEVIIGKHRNGGLADIKLRFIKEYAKFMNLDTFETGFNSGSTFQSSMNEEGEDSDAPF